MAGRTGGLRANWILNRETVGRYLRLARSKPAISTPGSESDPAAKPAISTPGLMAGRQSLCQPWQPQIEAAVSVGLSAQRIYQDLVGDYGFSGSYQAVKRFVRQLRQTQPIPFVRMEVEPGVEAQVDFGQGAWVMVDGKRKRQAFVSDRFEPFAQGLQRSGLAADDRELHPMSGKCVSLLWRSSQNAGD